MAVPVASHSPDIAQSPVVSHVPLSSGGTVSILCAFSVTGGSAPCFASLGILAADTGVGTLFLPN